MQWNLNVQNRHFIIGFVSLLLTTQRRWNNYHKLMGDGVCGDYLGLLERIFDKQNLIVISY